MPDAWAGPAACRFGSSKARESRAGPGTEPVSAGREKSDRLVTGVALAAAGGGLDACPWVRTAVGSTALALHVEAALDKMARVSMPRDMTEGLC